MKKTFSITLVAIVVAAVLSLCAIVWLFYGKMVPPKDDVKGVSTVGAIDVKPGFGISVTSQKGTWDTFVYLCKDKAECLASLDSGVRWTTVGGGEAADKDVFIEAKDSWKKYSYVKVFVKPGWGSPSRTFEARLEKVPLSVEKSSLEKDNEKVEIVVFPSIDTVSNFYKISTFTDLSL
jgi:hypothetical protein